MQRRSFLLIASIFLLGGCDSGEERPDGYVSRPSMLLSTYNLSHSRIHISSSSSGVLTFSSDATFTYESPAATLQGTWSTGESVVSINEEVRSLVSSIDYSTDDGYSLTTTFILSDSYELSVGDTFILSGDQYLSGEVTQIEVNNLN